MVAESAALRLVGLAQLLNGFLNDDVDARHSEHKTRTSESPRGVLVTWCGRRRGCLHQHRPVNNSTIHASHPGSNVRLSTLCPSVCLCVTLTSTTSLSLSPWAVSASPRGYFCSVSSVAALNLATARSKRKESSVDNLRSNSKWKKSNVKSICGQQVREQECSARFSQSEMSAVTSAQTIRVCGNICRWQRGRPKPGGQKTLDCWLIETQKGQRLDAQVNSLSCIWSGYECVCVC